MIANIVSRVLGPRIPCEDLRHRPFRYLLPTLFFLAAAGLLAASIQQPYWRMWLKAPQYPKGLVVMGHVDHITGDVQEIDELNHYIGMRPLNDAARFEKAVAVESLWAVAILLVLAGTVIHNRLAILLAIPAVLFPLLFIVDLHLWLKYFGTHLDPHAPLSSSIKPFVPPVLGIGKVGQFRTVASAQTGLIMAAIASGLVVIGLWFHRAAYKPFITRRSGSQTPAPEGCAASA